MAEPISIQQLKDASLDVKSLEEVVNGDENVVVTTRLGETYPSVKGSIKELFENGGLPATPFATKALMTASALVDGDYAMVTEDTANNGLYVKTAGTWIKSDYDAVAMAKTYTDQELTKKANINSPSFTGKPKVPRPAHDSRDGSVANTEFVLNAIESMTGRYYNISLTGHDEDEYILPEVYRGRFYYIFTGVVDRDITIRFPKETNRQIWILNSSTNKNMRVGVVGTSASIKIEGGIMPYLFHPDGVWRGGTGFALRENASLSGNSTTDTPSLNARSLEIINAGFFSKNMGKVEYLEVSDDMVLDIHNTQMFEIIGTLKKDITITLPNYDRVWFFRNRTAGGYNVSIVGAHQGQVPPVTLVNRDTAVNTLQGKSTLLDIGGSSDSGSGGVNFDGVLKHKGVFKLGEEYSAGDVVAHGSGIYVTKVDIPEATESPLDNPKYSKLMHNPEAGPDKVIKVLDIVDTDPEVYTPQLSSMSRDGMQLFSRGEKPLKVSDDWGKTWRIADYVSPDMGHVRWVNTLPNGEVVLSMSQDLPDGTVRSALVISNGWDKKLRSADSWDEAISINRGGVHFAFYAFSTYKNFVVVGEYGNKDVSETEEKPFARYVYLSKDYGKTFDIIFDLKDHTDGKGVHVHSVLFDHYWNRIWVSHGDGQYGSSQMFYSDDLGETWVLASELGVNFPQSVGMVAMPTCILLASDSYPNGVQRIDRAQGRTPVKGYYTVEAGYYIPEQINSLNHILSAGYQSEWLPNNPVIYGWYTENNPGLVGCVATFDGWTFHEIWLSDEIFPTFYGVSGAVGITPDNKILFGVRNNVDGVNKYYYKKVTVSVE